MFSKFISSFSVLSAPYSMEPVEQVAEEEIVLGICQARQLAK